MQIVPAKAAYGIYPRGVELQAVAKALNQAGFGSNEICLLLAPGHPIATEVQEMRCFRGSSTSKVALETLMSWLIGLGAVVISNLAFFVRSRDFVHALVEDRVSAQAGHRGALANLGVPECEAGRLGARISNGGGLIYVNCGNSTQYEPALQVLRQTGAEETSCLPPVSSLAFFDSTVCELQMRA